MIYSVYNESSGKSNDMPIVYDRVGFKMTRILLDTYPGGRINIQANASRCTSTSAPVKCVKMVLENLNGDKVERYEKVEPYWFYGDSNGVTFASRPTIAGFTWFSTYYYPTANCTGDTITTSDVNLQLIRRTNQTVYVPPISVTYNGTNTSVATKAETFAVLNATCNFLQKALPGLTLRCWKVSNSARPLKIAFRFMSNFIVPPLPFNDAAVGQWPNSLGISKVELTNSIRKFLSEQDAIEYGGSKFITYTIWLKGYGDRTSFSNAISDSNPYSSYKNLIVE